MNMFFIFRSVVLAALATSLVFGGNGGTISGTVKGPTGAAFAEAFVGVRNTKTKISVNVLSDRQGRYHVENLTPGEYDILATAAGFQADPRTGLKVGAGEAVTL